jgi:hypothetical protein
MLLVLFFQITSAVASTDVTDNYGDVRSEVSTAVTMMIIINYGDNFLSYFGHPLIKKYLLFPVTLLLRIF